MMVSTKDKIRDTAHNLFAKKGYDAVSIRDISKEAGVNIAAINYHFENKMGLYQAVIDYSVNSMVEDLEIINQKYPEITTQEYVHKMFSYFLKNEARMLSTFKFFMSMSEIFKEIEVTCIHDDKPPGGKILESLLIKEIPNIKEQDLGWAIRSITALTFHKAIVCCNKCVIESKKKFGITQKLFLEDLMRTVKLIVDSLKK